MLTRLRHLIRFSVIVVLIWHRNNIESKFRCQRKHFLSFLLFWPLLSIGRIWSEMCVNWWEGYLMELLIQLRQCWDFTSELAAVTQNLRAWEHLSACIALLATWLVVGILPAWLRFFFIWRVDIELDRCNSWVSHFRRLLCKVVSPDFLSHS